MKRLFNLDETYTHEANELLCEAVEVIQPLMKKMVREGFYIRDIQTILLDAVNDISICERLSTKDINPKSSSSSLEEEWIFSNAQALASVQLGLEQSATGEAKSLGSFKKYLKGE